MSTSSEHPAELDAIPFEGVVSKHSIIVVLFFLHLKIKSTGNEDLLLEYISPFVNTRSVAIGRVSDNVKFEPERLQNTVICGALCVNITMVDSTDTSNVIRGCNIFSGEEDPSELFDFNVAHSDLFHFYLINETSKDARLSFFKTSTDTDNKGYLKTFDFDFQKMMRTESPDKKVNSRFFKLVERFCLIYNDFQSLQDFKDLIITIDLVGKLLGITIQIPKDFDKLPIELQAVIKFQKVVDLRLCNMDGNHRTTHLMIDFFGFKVEKETKTFRPTFCASNEAKIDFVKKYLFIYELYSKAEGVDDRSYLDGCRMHSEETQDNASNVIPREKVHGICSSICILKEYYSEELGGSDSISKQFRKDTQENLGVHVFSKIVDLPIKRYKTKFRYTLLELYKIPQGKDATKSSFTDAEPSTSFYTLLYGDNSKKKKYVDLKDESSKSNIKTVTFLDDCYDGSTVEYVLKLFDDLYHFLHHKATKSHNIQPTIIVNDSLCEQVLILQADLIKDLIEGVQKLTDDKRFVLSYVSSDEKTHQVTGKVMKRKAKVVASVFSFFSILFIVEKIGLFPIVPGKLWKYKDTTQDAPMRCSILKFLSFVFNHNKYRCETFYDCFSAQLGSFLTEYHNTDGENKPDIFQHMNTESYKNAISKWLKDYAISNFYEEFYRYFIIPSQEEFGQVELASMLSRKPSHVENDDSSMEGSQEKNTKSSASPTSKKKRKKGPTMSVSSSVKKPRVEQQKVDSVMEFCLIQAKGSTGRSTRHNNTSTLLCENCEEMNKKNKTPETYEMKYAAVQIITRSSDSGTVEKNSYCFFHATGHHSRALREKKYIVVCDTGINFKEPNEDKVFRAVDFDLIQASYFTEAIKKNIKSNVSPGRSCSENENMCLECPTTCDGGPICPNKILSNLRTFELGTVDEIKGRICRKSTNSDKGYGLFAMKKYSKGEGIVEYVGSGFLYTETEKFPNSKYIIQLEGNCYLDAEAFGNLSRFINHSCEPNAKFQKVVVGGMPALVVIALEDISKNNEITANYRALPRIRGSESTPCLCGAKTCIKFIEGEEAQNSVVDLTATIATDDKAENESQGKVEETVNKPDKEEESSDEEEIEESVIDSDEEEESSVEEVIEENTNVFTDEEVLKSIQGGIENNKKKEEHSICYFIVSIQLLFRGINKTLFQDRLDALGDKDPFLKGRKAATNQDKVLFVAKTIVEGYNMPFSMALLNLAVETNSDAKAAKSDSTDTIAKHQNFLDAKDTVQVLIDFFFEECMRFWKRVYMVEENQQPHLSTKKRNTSDKIQKKRKKNGEKKKEKENEEVVNNDLLTIQSKVTDYDLQSIISSEITSKNNCEAHWDLSNSSAEFKYFIVEVQCLPEYRFEKRLNNTIALELNCGVRDFNGFAILKSFIYLADHHFTVYVHDRKYNAWHLYDEEEYFTNVVEGTALAKYAYLLLYEYCTEAEYRSFINAKDTVLSKWETLVEKALNIVHLFYFLQYNGSNLVGGIGMLEKSVSDAFEIEFFSDQGHLIGKEGELNSYGLHTVRALTDACLKGYNGEGPWKEFPKSVFETFMGIVKHACVVNAGGPPKENTWVAFFCQNVYPELSRGVLLKHHPDQDSYVKPSVVVDVIRKALQREEEQVAPMEETKDGSIADEENADGASQDHPTESTGNPLEGTKTRENNMKDGLIAEEENEGGAPPGQGTGPTGPPLEETQAQENNMKDGSIVGGQNAGGAASGQPTEPTGASSEKTQAQENKMKDGSIADEENEGGAPPGQGTGPTGPPLEETQAQEEEKEDGSKLVLEILKRQLSCVIDNRYKSVEEYVPKAILTLTPEEVKVIDAKKDLAANDAIKSVIERMQEDYGGSEDEDGSTESDDSWKVSRYRYSKDEVKCWFDSLKKCHAYDLGFAADPGTDDKKCWCPCCDKCMSPWWKDCKIEDIAGRCEKSKKDGCKDPHGLLQHLQGKAKSCEIHYGVNIYLHQLYKDPYGIGVGHRALYNQSDSRYKEALAAAEKATKERAARIDLQLKAAAVAEKKPDAEQPTKNIRVATKPLVPKKARIQNLLKEIKEVYDVDEDELDEETKEMITSMLAEMIGKKTSKSSTATK